MWFTAPGEKPLETQEVRCEEIQHSKQGHLFPCTRRMVAES